MRRFLSLLLIVASGWMLYQSMEPFSGVSLPQLPTALARSGYDPAIVLPLISAVLGLLGGITVFLGGAGGALIALLGGIIASSFALLSGETVAFPDLQIWENEAMVAIAMVAIAGWAAISRPIRA